MLTSPEYEFGAALMHYEEMVQQHPNGGEEFGKARRRVLDLFQLSVRSSAPNEEERDDIDTAIAVLRQAGYGPLADRLAGRL